MNTGALKFSVNLAYTHIHKMLIEQKLIYFAIDLSEILQIYLYFFVDRRASKF